MVSRWLKRLIIFFLVLLGVELVARFYLGLGHLPIYIENPDYEYIYAPNQNLSRFGNKIHTNEFSMRSNPLSSEDSLIVLKFGDSVINGGAHVDQDSLSTTLLEKSLSEKFDKRIRVLNISAQSWGPDNAYAYLKKHGNFNASLFVLVFSSHDLHDNMHHKKVVGKHKAWPDHQPLCALTDGWSRYLWPRVKSWFGGKDEEYDYLYDFDDSEINSGWKDFADYSEENKIPLLVYLHPEIDEIKMGEYNKYGKQLLALLENLNVTTIQGLSFSKKSFYRDNIHLNEAGHNALAGTLSPYLENHVDSMLNHRKNR